MKISTIHIYLRHTHTRLQLSGFCWGQSGWADNRKHSPTHTYCGHRSSHICFLHLLSIHSLLPVQLMCLTVFFHNLFPSFFGLPLGLAPSLYTPYISSSNNCLLFAAHAHTITTCFAVVPTLCYLTLVSLNPLLGAPSCRLMPHIHLTILISACRYKVINVSMDFQDLFT